MLSFFMSLFQKNIKNASSSSLPHNQGGKEFNKFMGINENYFITLARKTPAAASSQLRGLFVEVSDFANPSAIGCVLLRNSADWHKLARLLVDDDPTLVKTIYINLLRVRNFSKLEDAKDIRPANFTLVSRELYAVERKSPETKAEGEIAVWAALLEGSSPKEPFWRVALEKSFDLACQLTKPEDLGHMDLIARAAFYAHGDKLLGDKFLGELLERVRNPNFLINTPRTRCGWSRGYFFSRMHKFCIKEKFSGINISFVNKENADFYSVLIETFWFWVHQYYNVESYEVLEVLQHGIHCDDEKFSSEATEAYIKYFSSIAKKDPKKASECLYQIARYSCCIFSHAERKEMRHQNYNLCKVLDSAIPTLREIDANLSIYPFFAYLNEYGGPHSWIQRKYNSEIIMASLHQKEMQSKLA